MTLLRLFQNVALVGAIGTSTTSAGEVFGSLQTPWTAEASQEMPLPEYPRPQLVRSDNWKNLNGKWNYALLPVNSPKPTEWDGEILVPFAIESQLSGVGQTVGAAKDLWYHRSFKPPAGDRVLLHFGAVDWRATVWVNGKEVGMHEGGFTPFSFDITDALQPGGEQELVVRVWDPADSEPQPRGKQVEEPHGIYYTSVTGIWQTVWVEGVRPAYITHVQPEADLSAGVVRVTAEARGAKPGAKVTVTVLNDGKRIGSVDGVAGSPVEVAVPEAKLWAPGSPHLYDLEITLEGGDKVESYFAMREISAGPDEYGMRRLLLNGKPLFHLGFLDQGWWPDGLYTAPTDEALRWDIEKTLEMGFNMARKHVKVEPARWYRHADELGLLVWQDMPTGYSQPEQNIGFGAGKDAVMPEPWKTNFRRELKEVIDAVRFFPSVVIWVPFNEGWGQHDTNEILQWTAQYDPTRLVDGPSGWEDLGWGHLKDKHIYPGPEMFPIMDDRVSVLGEFGGLGLVTPGHLWQEDRNWGYQNLASKEALEKRYARLIEDLHPLIEDGLAAAVYTQTTDVEGEVNGLITYDRRVVKLDEKWLADLHQPLYEPHPPMKEEVVVSTSEEEAQEWSYTFTKPEDAWRKPEFDASAWEKGPGGFGTKETPGAVVGTEWRTDDIWIRREFELNDPNIAGLRIRLSHDDEADVYINGTLVHTADGWTTSYRTLGSEEKLRAALKPGRNTVAIHCHQKGGGQFIDFGLVARTPVKLP